MSRNMVEGKHPKLMKKSNQKISLNNRKKTWIESLLRWKHHWKEPVPEVKENPTGCARTEPCPGKKGQHNDMFKWLSSRHR